MIEAESKARAIVEKSANRTVEDSRIARLTPVRRTTARIKRQLIGAVVAGATGILIIWIAAFIVGNVVNFVASLVYAWYFWTALFGSSLLIWGILMFAMHWRVAFTVTCAIPRAVYAAVLERG